MTARHASRTTLTRVGMFAVAATLVAGCAGVGLGGAGVAPDLVVDQVNTGRAVKEQAEKAAGQMGSGQVPATKDRCPDDANALRELFNHTDGKSQLNDGEQRAADALFRAALNCDPTVTEPWLDWSAR